jgi:phosphoenolpyruvate carboxykinase (GTP)
MWPGFGENSRVLEWIIKRLDHEVPAADTAIGRVPAEGSLDFTGLDMSAETAEELFAIDPVTWLAEADLTEEYFDKFGDRVPAELRSQLASLRERLQQA